MATAHPSPFSYEDSLESSIQSVIARNNKFDPTGKLNDLRIPPRRVQQSLRRPKWYSPSHHASAPYLSASIAQPSSTLTPGVPLTLTVTLHHHPSPTGNPSSQPVTLQLRDTHLTTIDRRDFFPWLLLRHDPHALEGGRKEIEGDDENEGHGPAEPWEGLGNDDTGPSSSVDRQQPPLVSTENGFVTIAVGESKTFQVHFRPEPGLVKQGERYEICFRGVEIVWWRFGWMEEFATRGVRKVEEEGEEEGAKGRIVVPCSNLVEIVVEGER